MTSDAGGERIRIDRADGLDEHALAEDVLDGLARPLKELPSKFFYDDRGSALFERICELPEYYPTRTERSILAAAPSGSRASTKACASTGSSATSTATSTGSLHPPGRASSPSSGGPSATSCPARVGASCAPWPACWAPTGHLLLGTDLVKDPSRLEAAYDDSAGVTAEFNRNVLHVVNRVLGGDFRPELFEHVAFYDRERAWVEMRLRASERCTVTLAALDLRLELSAREELRTEISAKFTRERLRADLTAAGLELEVFFTDADDTYGLSLSRLATGARVAVGGEVRDRRALGSL
jgi:L-histidine N-alpha-methyltransferase